MIVIDIIVKTINILLNFILRLYNKSFVSLKPVVHGSSKRFFSYMTKDVVNDTEDDDDDENNNNDDKNREMLCYICLDTMYHRSDATKLLPCRHNNRFHINCLWNWVLQKSSTDFRRSGIFHISCPLCRRAKTSYVCDNL
jgi:hypothetical protein